MIPPDGTSSTDNLRTSYSGNEVTVTDEAGNTRSSWNDALGRLTQVSEGAVGYITDYTYDALGNLTCVEQHGGVSGTGCSSPPSNDSSSPWRVRRFTYDSLSRLLTAKNPETGTISYGYNADGVLTSKTDARGITITYNPDALHRIASKTYSDSEPTISYTYDNFTLGSNYGIGRRTGMSDASGSTSWTYDTMGRVWSEQKTIGTIGKSTSDLYNFDGSVKQITYPSGAVISVTTGGDGRPLSETDTTNGINYVKSLVYAPPGQISTATYGYVSGGYAGIMQTNSFNSRGQPIRLQACGLSSCTDGSGSQTPFLLDLSYSLGLNVNDNGNVQGITNNKNTARSQNFTYDGLNRVLTAQSGSAWGINFTNGIDAWGNLFQTNTISGTGTNPMPVNQGVSGKNEFTLMGYTYDTAGNVLSDGGGSYPCLGYTYTWNAEEQMTCAVGASYTYDGDGVRVKKTGGSATATLYWGLVESDTSGNLTSEYIFLGDRRIARRDIATGNVYYYFADALGSSNVVASSTGALENESDFYPFGGELGVTQNLSNQKYKFEGKERDPESSTLSQPQGLDNFGARFDSSSAGRFMSPDWANSPEPVPYARLGNPQTLNLYAFAQNNPESAPDLDGHQLPLCPDIGGCGGEPRDPSEQDMSDGAIAQRAFAMGMNPGQAISDFQESLVQAAVAPSAAFQVAQQQNSQQNAQFTAFASHLRLVVTSDTAQAGIRDIVYTVVYLSYNGNLQNLDAKSGAQYPKVDVTENNSAYCQGCTKDAAGVYHSTDTGGNRFEDLVSPQPAGNRLQSFSVSPQGGGPSAPISVRLAGKDYGTIGQWSNGINIPYINGYSFQRGLPGGYAPSQ